MAELKPQPWNVAAENIGLGKLRIVAPDAEARLGAALGLPCPAAGRVTRDDHFGCIRIGPHEWLVTGDTATVQAALARASDAFRDDLALILDISHGGVVLQLSGAAAVERIAAYCDIDLHADSFPSGHATRTRFGDVAVTLARIDDRPSYWLIGDQSLTDYLKLLLAHGTDR